MNTLFNDSMTILQQIHFLRTDWFFAFIPLFIYAFLYFTKTSDSKNWQSIVDPQLQNFVLEKTGGKQSTYPVFLIFIATSLCITALAGPVYKKLPQPVYQEQSALVVLLDLSQSMNATDVKPSRLARAKLELLDILKTRKSGQTAFIVYAADAFTVTPLTDDNATIANLIPSLETSMMPAQGSNLSKGLTKAFSLLTQAGVIHGNILVISDDIHPRDETAIKKLVSQGHRLSIFGIGTTEGSPVPIGGGFLLNKQGAIVIPKLHPKKLQNFAFTGGGLYTSLAAGDQDTLKLTKLFQSNKISKEVLNNSNSNDINADIWQEEGHWLLLPLLLFVALWARKGWIAIAILFILPIPQPAYAQQAYSIDTDNLWSSEDQKAMRAFNKGKISEAAKQFNHQEWKASALYKNGDYQAAADVLKDNDTSNGYYNKGNALAKLGNYEAAIKAYNEAIELDAKNSDAEYNRDQVKQALKKQKNASQNNENKESSNKDKEDKNKSDKSDAEKQQSSDKNSEKQDGENKESEDSKSDDDNSKSEKASDEQQSKPSNKDNDSENKQNEEELKKRNAQQEAKKQKEEQEQFKQEQKNADKEQVENDAEHKDDNENKKTPKEIEINPEEISISEAEKATKQWLKRIPDDPGGLLKRKFLYQYNQLPNQTDEQEPW